MELLKGLKEKRWLVYVVCKSIPAALVSQLVQRLFPTIFDKEQVILDDGNRYDGMGPSMFSSSFVAYQLNGADERSYQVLLTYLVKL